MQSPVRSKRPRSTPTFQTPVRPLKRAPLRELAPEGLHSRRRILPSPVKVWSQQEISALVEFVLLHCPGDSWPTHMRMDMWNAAGDFVRVRTGGEKSRTGNACRFKVVGWLKKKFTDPKEAEKFYGINCLITREVQTAPPPSQSSCAVQIEPGTSTCEVQTDVSVKPFCNKAIGMNDISEEFSKLCFQQFQVHVPNDFLIHASAAMANLAENSRSNVLYALAKGIGTMREDNSDALFPIRRMPMGMIEYAANFFSAESINQVPKCPEDYRLWQQTMYCQFGQKWAKLHHGPMWRVSHSAKSAPNSHERVIDQALVNIPATHESSLRRDIASSGISMDSKIQLCVLDEAVKAHPTSWWWIKADGCDIVSGLCESARGEWSGDVNLHEEELNLAFSQYKKRLEWVENIGMERQAEFEGDMDTLKVQVTDDVKFIDSTLQRLNHEYENKVAEGKQGKDMFSLAWDVKELEALNEEGRLILTESSVLKDRISNPAYDVIANNLALQVSKLKQKLLKFVKRVTKFRRLPATHVLVVMISPEERQSKPYALTVQCIAYKSIKDSEIRVICNSIVREMTLRHMQVAGFVTNGEWNSLRSKGNTRPLSVFEIRSLARNKYSHTSINAMQEMLTPIRSGDGIVKAQRPNPAISCEQLEEILAWKEEGCTIDDIVTRLRQRTVPKDFKTHTWCPGRSETQAEVLKSILAQFEYKFLIDFWEDKGVPFRSHLHVPEDHPVTGHMFCEREDEGHVFKRIAGSLRRGCVETIRLERFVEALHDPSTGLTHPALSGIRKQSVEDVERLFGEGVIQFMEDNGYEPEMTYLRMVRNWRRAIDERGIPATDRLRYCKDFLDFIVKDLIPWHVSGETDLSTLEVNRPINNVRGFTRETLIALAADIETRIWRATQLEMLGLPPEHPRSSTSDDVECFFSILRDTVGKSFTLQQVYYGWRKVCLEFVKRMDPDLPFYYYTSNHQRFYEGEMPSFNLKSSKPKKVKRAPTRELLGGTGRRVSLPVRGSISLRAEFHNVPVNLPPPPDSSATARVTSEHAYASVGPI